MPGSNVASQITASEVANREPLGARTDSFAFWWLIAMAVLVAIMVLIGGVTRLTGRPSASLFSISIFMSAANAGVDINKAAVSAKYFILDSLFMILRVSIIVTGKLLAL